MFISLTKSQITLNKVSLTLCKKVITFINFRCTLLCLKFAHMFHFFSVDLTNLSILTKTFAKCYWHSSIRRTKNVNRTIKKKKNYKRRLQCFLACTRRSFKFQTLNSIPDQHKQKQAASFSANTRL